jgi:hypothetical protein
MVEPGCGDRFSAALKAVQLEQTRKVKTKLKVSQVKLLLPNQKVLSYARALFRYHNVEV